MSKAVTLGNGKILIGFDHRGQVRDLYFPHVGLENHVSHYAVHRIGVWVDGELSWTSDADWEVSVDCDQETSVGKVVATHARLGLRLRFTDVVYNEKNVLVRRVRVENLTETTRVVKLFFGHQFRISETARGDTGYFDPRCNSLVHYKGRRVFLMNAQRDGAGFDDYTVGLFDVDGKEGSHMDAYDGMLAKNPIEHGSVDSMMSLTCTLPEHGVETVHYWMCIGNSVEEVRELNAYVIGRTPEHLMKTTRDFWHAWVNKRNFNFYGLNSELVDLFKKSLIIIRAHVDEGGAIIASSDSALLQHGRDTYSYLWPRDGALSARALDRAGDFTIARRFFAFCSEVIESEGYFMHKYRSDKSLGSSWHPWIRDGKVELPIQEDETALVLYALWDHYELSKEIEFIEQHYNTLITPAAEFLKSYILKDTDLPYPSYDLWEENFGVSTFTCASVYGALMAAHRFASLLGKHESASEYRHAAERVRNAIFTYLYDEESGTFYKLLTVERDGTLTPDRTIDMSSFYGIFRFGVLDADDKRLERAYDGIVKNLITNDVGGVPRYENDTYFRSGKHSPPNPWFITTLWLAQYWVARAKEEKDLDVVKHYLQWTERHALRSGVLSEQLDPYTGAQRSVAPLTWSHAEFVNTVIDYLEKLEQLGICDMCNPVDR